MPKLIITADIHGNYNSWIAIKALLNKNDSLVVAGDLFDTRYGNYTNPAFDPEAIKNDLNFFSQPFFYVYGNCDTPSFFPGFNKVLKFEANKKKICLCHGDSHFACNIDADVIIQGHTHVAVLERKKNRIFMNPGTITSPRNGLYTYGVIENDTACLIDLKTGNKLISLSL
ncbi:MAG: YfcE family phosphodiesterase [Desulfobacula sp.]|nr:YfcE family phosphodiesterase [Desulfobacula sp.]